INAMNQHRLEEEEPIVILHNDNSVDRDKQIERIAKIQAECNEETVPATLQTLTKAAATGEGNLLACAVDGARARATTGELTDAIEKVSGRHKAVIRSGSGVYSSNFSEKEEIDEVNEMTEEFLENEGRRPRIMVAKMGQDGHDRGAKVVASSYA